VGDRDLLLALLRRVRRRWRLQRGASGAMIGAGLALTVAIATLASGARWTGWLGALAGVLPLLGGIAAAVWRAPSAARCARALDEAAAARAGREVRNADRVFVALALVEGEGEILAAAFVRAAVRDALGSAGVEDAVAAAPWRKPAAWPVLAGLTAAALVLTLLPARSPARRASGDDRRATHIRRAPIATELAALARARQEATRLQDAELGTIADRFAAVLAKLERDGLDRRAAFDEISELARGADAAAKRGEPLRMGLTRAGAALANSSVARAVGEAMATLDGAAAQKAFAALASRVEVSKPGAAAAQRQELAEALAGAAAEAGRRQSGAAEERRRRLTDPEASTVPPPPDRTGGPANEAPPERQLERLERDLGDSAADCRRDSAACAASLRRNAEAAAERGREAQQARARRDLAEALARAQDLGRERANGGDEAGGGAPRAERAASASGAPAAARAFERAARGESPGRSGARGAGDEAGGGEPSSPAGSSERSGPASGGEPSSVASGGAARGGDSAITAGAFPATGGEPSSATGDGTDPLGEPTSVGDRGRAVEASIADGPGPARADVIESGAREGFARTSYQRVFREYEAAVEETLDATAVPAGRRQLVRRYFELIRPRPAH
jgi:hypothetical protein